MVCVDCRVCLLVNCSQLYFDHIFYFTLRGRSIKKESLLDNLGDPLNAKPFVLRNCSELRQVIIMKQLFPF